MAVKFDARAHRFFEHEDYPRTGERTPLSATEQAQHTARKLRAEADNGTRGYTLPLSVLVSAPPRRGGKG